MDLEMPGAPKPEILTSTHSGKLKYILGFVIIVFAGVLGGSLYFYSQKPPAAPARENNIINQIAKPDTKSFASPLKIDPRLIKSQGLSYVIQTQIKSLDTSKEPLLITSNITDSTMPRIEVSKSTALFVRRGGKDYPVKITQFQPGNNILISLFYNIDKSKWVIPKIVKIVNNATASATPRTSTRPSPSIKP